MLILATISLDTLDKKEWIIRGKLLALLTYLLCTSSYALPGKVSIFFLSPLTAGKTSWLPSGIKWLGNVAQNEAYECVPMGGGCFHPQLGFIEDANSLGKVEESKPVKLKTMNALETDVMDCDKDYYFDIYCGSAKKQKAQGKAKLELWIDTSSSLRSVDSAQSENFCYRKSFAERVFETCGNKVRVSLFDTSKKAMGTFNDLCGTYGLNDQTRLMKWIEDSDVEHLVLVTDIDELSMRLSDFLDRIGAKIYGVGTKGMEGPEFTGFAKEIAKSCQI